MFFFYIYKYIYNELCTGKGGRGLQDSEEGMTLPARRPLMGFYVAFLYRIELFVGKLVSRSQHRQLSNDFHLYCFCFLVFFFRNGGMVGVTPSDPECQP